MKKILMAATAIAALAIGSPALADAPNTGPDVEVFTINGTNPAKCNLEAASGQIVTLGADVISDTDGFANPGLATEIANGMAARNITAWCTGDQNSIVLSRSALTTDGGNATTNGFNQAVVYDLQIDIPTSQRAGGAPVNEGTSDGPGNGPGIGAGAGLAITRFGPNGVGDAVTFVQEPGSTVSAATNGAPGVEQPRSAYSENGSRLVAGDYTGTLTITLAPGV